MPRAPEHEAADEQHAQDDSHTRPLAEAARTCCATPTSTNLTTSATNRATTSMRPRPTASHQANEQRRERDEMKRGRTPPAAHQDREADDERHRHTDAGRHETGDAEQQSDCIATIEWAVVVSEYEMRESTDE